MIPERYVMVLLCALCCFINYADRVNMSVAIISIGEQYKYTVREQGIIMSMFFMGYLPMQIGSAVLCRRFGGKTVLSYGAFLWSMFTVLTPLAAWLGYYALLLCRVLMGLSEGVAFPAIFHFLSNWIPANERASSVGLFLTGVHVGTTTALILSPIIIRLHSWELIFYSFGGAGIVWILAWHFIAYDRDGKQGGSGPIEYDPQSEAARNDTREDGVVLVAGDAAINGRKSASSSDSVGSVLEEALIPENSFSSAPKPQKSQGSFNIFANALSPNEARSIRFILTDRKCMAVCLTQAIFGFIHYTILSWLPSYFKHVYEAKTTSLSFTFLPYLSMAISANIGGFAADRLLLLGISLTRARKIVTVVANGGAAAMLIMFSLAGTVKLALVYISLGMAFMSLNTGGFESSFLDMASPSLSGIFKATANTMASFSGFVAIPFATLVLRWSGESWRFVFGSLSAWFMLMIAVYCSFGSSDRVLTEESR